MAGLDNSPTGALSTPFGDQNQVPIPVSRRALAGPRRLGKSADNTAGRQHMAYPAIESLESRTFLSGNGLSGTYYNNMLLSDPILTRVDPTIDFRWGTTGPGSHVPATQFSAQWTGAVLAPTTGTYSFITTSDDGVRVWVNGKEIINDWSEHGAKNDTGTIALSAGVKYAIQIDYYQDVGVATCILQWSSSTIPQQLVPTADLFSTTPAPATAATSQPPIAGSWNMAFDDEFNTLNTNNWTTANYWWHDNKGTQATFEPNNVSVSNGILSITAKRQNTTSEDGTVEPYSSGLLQSGGILGVTPHGFAFTYGYVEMRTKIAPGQGMWSAFWMLPVSHQDNYEVDIFENLGREPTTFRAFDHDWPSLTDTVSYNSGVDETAGWHTYGVDWEPGSITWYMDGKAVAKYTNATAVPNQPMYLLMNLDVGGAVAGPLTSASPAASTWQIDYIRVWQH